MNALVAYFSATGTTAKAAKVLANAVGGELYEIKPAVPYTSADLNWMDKNSRSSVEMKDAHSRPALADTDAPVAGHDVIFLGFPVWWYHVPQIIKTFVTEHDLTGKTVAVFSTSGGSSVASTLPDIEALCPGVSFSGNLTLDGDAAASQLDRVDAWLGDLGLR